MRKYAEKIGQWISRDIAKATPIDYFLLKIAFILVGTCYSLHHFLRYLLAQGN